MKKIIEQELAKELDYLATESGSELDRSYFEGKIDAYYWVLSQLEKEGELMELDNVDTLNDLKEWLGEHMTGATISEGAGGIVINTGLASSMGGYLSPIEKEGK